MAHIEMQLLSRIIRTGCIAEVLEWGITPSDFRTTEGRGLFISIVGYWRAGDSQGAVPGPVLIKSYYPSFEFCDDASMTLAAFCSEVRKNRMATEAREYANNHMGDMDVDPVGTINKLVADLTRLQSLGMKTNDSVFSDGMADAWIRYQNAKNGVASSSLLWPWEPFNRETAGIQEDDYIVLYGRPKSMKSFVLSAMAASAYDQGKNVLIYTKEMPAWQLFRRVGACIAQLPYSELRLGTLSPEDEQRFRDLYTMVEADAKRSNGRHNIICISGQDAPAGQDSMSWVRSKVDKYKPDVVFIDGLYLMSGEGKPGRDHERVSSISRAARAMVLATKIPLIATMQANRAAAKHANAELDEIAFSDSIGQDTTAAIRVINEKQELPTIALVIGGSREFKMHGARIHGRPCVDFTFKEEMSDKDIQRATAKDGDNEAEAKKKSDAVKRTPITKKKEPPTTNISAEVLERTEDIQ